MGLEFTSRVLSNSGMPIMCFISGLLVYYHCIIRNFSLVSLVCDVLMVLVCSLAAVGIMFRYLNVSVPVDPLEWRVSQEAASGIVESMVNIIGALESAFRLAVTGQDKKLFLKVVVILYILSAVGRAVSGATIAFAVLWLASMIFSTSKLSTNGSCPPSLLTKRKEKNDTGELES